MQISSPDRPPRTFTFNKRLLPHLSTPCDVDIGRQHSKRTRLLPSPTSNYRAKDFLRVCLRPMEPVDYPAPLIAVESLEAGSIHSDTAVEQM
jgi:hypothetical protein